MSEIFLGTAEFEPAVVIAETLRNWFAAEIESSGQGRNAVLDDWNTFHEDLALPWSDSSNANTAKAKSHFNRLDQWTQYAKQDPSILAIDSFMARQIFCAQMFVSGAFRRQCFIESTGPEDYRQRRFEGGPVGIDLLVNVTHELSRLAPNSPEETTTIPADCILDITLHTNDRGLEVAKYVNDKGLSDMGQENSGSVTLLKTSQEAWSKLVVDYIVFATQERGGQLARVPFLEPKSISEEPQVYYPFKD